MCGISKEYGLRYVTEKWKWEIDQKKENRQEKKWGNKKTVEKESLSATKKRCHEKESKMQERCMWSFLHVDEFRDREWACVMSD